MYGTDEPALHEIPQMILAQETVAREKVPHRVELTPERFDARHADHTAEFGFGQNTNLGAFAVQLLGALQFLALFGGAESLGTDDDQRRPGIDVISRRAAQADHVRAGVPAAERAELSCKNDNLTGKRGRGRQ